MTEYVQGMSAVNSSFNPEMPNVLHMVHQGISYYMIRQIYQSTVFFFEVLSTHQYIVENYVIALFCATIFELLNY